jgi:hypothetical protein
MKFFAYFPKTPYTFVNANGAYVLTITNPTVHVRLMEKVRQSITVLYNYQIEDDERPDTVSVNLYGTPDYTWVILLVNQFFTLFDWPLTNDEFNAYIIEKYGSVATALALLRYRTWDNYYVDVATWTALDVNLRGETQTTYDYEMLLNDDKRSIKVVPPEFVALLDIELKTILSS